MTIPSPTFGAVVLQVTTQASTPTTPTTLPALPSDPAGSAIGGVVFFIVVLIIAGGALLLYLRNRAPRPGSPSGPPAPARGGEEPPAP
jgi:hypothetical protein